MRLRLLLIAALLGGGCRALTTPGIQPDPGSQPVLLEGQILGPDGAPLSEGVLRLDNRVYTSSEDEWVQTQIALDEQGRFSEELPLGRWTDAVISPPLWRDLPDHRLVGLDTERMPWNITYSPRELNLALALPDSFLSAFTVGELRLTRRRPRPAGAGAFRDDFLLLADADATFRGWIDPGTYRVFIDLFADADRVLYVDSLDSVRIPEDLAGFDPLPVEELEVGLVLPPDIPSPASFSVEFDASLGEREVPLRISSSAPLAMEGLTVTTVVPAATFSVGVEADGVVLMVPDTWREIPRDQLPFFHQIRLGQYWLEVALPPAVEDPSAYEIELDGGWITRRAEPDETGRVLFLLERGSFLLRVSDPQDEVVHQQVYTPTASRTLQLDF